MDRINLQIVVHRLKPGEMTEQTTGEASKSIRDRVTGARDRARSRFKSNLICS